MASLRPLVSLALCALLAGCGCGDDDDDTIGGDASPPDGGDGGDAADAADSAVDSGVPCERDEDCADAVDCTVDRCDPDTHTCDVRPNDALCANEEFCDGDERCSPTEGCVPGPSRSCSDADVCTIDECDEATDECIHRGRDFDRDGHVDWHCEEGDDCNDDEPRIYTGAPEICGDLLDNDCNGLTEDQEECTSPGYDTCDSPMDVTGGGAFDLSLAGTVGDYFASCGFGATNDAVLTFTIDEEQDVEISVESDFVLTTAVLQEECGAELSEVECNWGFPARIRSRALPAGTYFIIVQAQGEADVLVVVEFDDPTPAPENETCDGAIDVSVGGRWQGSFVDVDNDHDVSCGFNYPELVYTFTLDEISDVDLTATAGFQYIPMAVSTECGDEDTEVRCSYSAPSHQHLYSLDPGTYYVLVEGSDEFDFTLDVSFGPPTEPPEGDLCDTAIDVSAGGSFEGTLVDRQDDVEISCGFAQADTMFFFDLAEEQDVTLRATGDGGEWMTLALQESCGERATEEGCRFGNPAAMRIRAVPPGRHSVIVESFAPTNFTLDVTLQPPVEPVVVDVSETCGAAFEAPFDGGIFEGDTSDASDDYAASCGGGARGGDEVIYFELLADARVTASLDPQGFDAVLHVHEDSCVGGDDELACNDDWIGDTSFFERDLGPGNYYFIVDGATVNDFGAYTLDLMVLFDD